MKVLKWVGIFFFSFFLLLYLLSFIVLDGKYVDIRRPGEALNPTSYVFNFSPARVKEVIDSCYVFYFRSNFGTLKLRISSWEKEIRWEKGKRIYFYYNQHIYSYVYRNSKGGRLEYDPDFYMKLDSLSPNRTLVQLVSENPMLYVGEYLAFNPRSGGIGIPRFVEVRSSTIEEYEVLKYIGKRLGEPSMPPIRYPKALDYNDVKSTFIDMSGNNTCPFTPEDVVFGDE